jgi:hypothetical protein
MIPDYLYGPLFILGGGILIALTVVRVRRGGTEGAFIRYGKLSFAVLMIGFGMLLIKAAGGH